MDGKRYVFIKDWRGVKAGAVKEVFGQLRKTLLEQGVIEEKGMEVAAMVRRKTRKSMGV